VPGVRIARGVLALAMGVAGPASASARVYAVAAGESAFTLHVGKAGLFGFAGHEHEVTAPVAQGRIVADAEALERSSVTLGIETAALSVTGKGEPAEDVPKVQAAMAGPKVLDVARFPRIGFSSRRVAGHVIGGGVYELEVTGDLALRDVTRSLTLRLRVQVVGDTLAASGATTLRQSQFGIRPLSVAGVVKVKDELAIGFHIVAHAMR